MLRIDKSTETEGGSVVIQDREEDGMQKLLVGIGFILGVMRIFLKTKQCGWLGNSVNI